MLFRSRRSSARPFSASKGRALLRLLDDAKAKGFPLRVAVIATRNDLGSVPSLFGTPQRYAAFLGEEDYYFFKDELLVVMPQGYGLHRPGGVPAADRRIVAALGNTVVNIVIATAIIARYGKDRTFFFGSFEALRESLGSTLTFTVPGVGKLKLANRKARIGRNPGDLDGLRLRVVGPAPVEEAVREMGAAPMRQRVCV